MAAASWLGCNTPAQSWGDDAPVADIAFVPRCTPGEQAVCACEDGASGMQSCTSGGRFEGCGCEPSDGGIRDANVDAAVSDASTLDAHCTPLRCGLDVACGDVNNGCGSTTMCVPCDGSVVLNVAAQHLAFDAAGHRLYATVAGSSLAHGDSLIAVNTDTLTIVAAPVVGSEPDVVDVSDDGSTVWIGLDGSRSVRSIDVRSMPPVLGAESMLQSESGAALYARDMQVISGSATRIAVLLGSTLDYPPDRGLVVFDRGAPRPLAIPSGPELPPTELAAGPTGWLFASRQDAFWTLIAVTDGVLPTRYSGLLEWGSGELVYNRGRVFAADGEMIDVASPSSPTSAGRFAHGGLFAPVDGTDRVVAIQAASGSGTTATLSVFDRGTLSESATTHVMNLTEPHLRDATWIGRGRVAVIASATPDFRNAQLVFIFDPLLTGL